MKFKICKICKKSLGVVEFEKMRVSLDGLHDNCISCSLSVFTSETDRAQYWKEYHENGLNYKSAYFINSHIARIANQRNKTANLPSVPYVQPKTKPKKQKTLADCKRLKAVQMAVKPIHRHHPNPNYTPNPHAGTIEPTPRRNKNQKSDIVQRTINGVEVSRHKGALIAANKTGIEIGVIMSGVVTGDQAGGFVWLCE